MSVIFLGLKVIILRLMRPIIPRVESDYTEIDATDMKALSYTESSVEKRYVFDR